jgi:DnaK suppressor protein
VKGSSIRLFESRKKTFSSFAMPWWIRWRAWPRALFAPARKAAKHQADAGSDAYDRDFALSLLSQEQDALYEIDEALKRIELGTYGKCEMSGKPIPRARLEAIPFARFTVECQSQLEKQSKASRVRQSVTSLFGLTEEETREGEEEEVAPTEVKE